MYRAFNLEGISSPPPHSDAEVAIGLAELRCFIGTRTGCLLLRLHGNEMQTLPSLHLLSCPRGKFSLRLQFHSIWKISTVVCNTENSITQEIRVETDSTGIDIRHQFYKLISQKIHISYTSLCTANIKIFSRAESVSQYQILRGTLSNQSTQTFTKTVTKKIYFQNQIQFINFCHLPKLGTH